ncbi:MAG: prolyl oligopeptidase family serine peptidase [Clostridia bacterium]|nr:prolyl oligopeptidase family serine peptidase [Clostridia bacterium]
MKSENLTAGWNSLLYNASNGVEMKYQLYIPEGYDDTKNYPAILYMHSAGVRCDDNSHIYTGEAKFLRNIENGKYKNDVLIIAPCCPKEAKWVDVDKWDSIAFDSDELPPSTHMAAALELFGKFLDTFSADLSRLYLYGMSMGGLAVWDILARRPKVFAAAAVAAGRGTPMHANRMLDVAIWIFHGTNDNAVPYRHAIIMHDALVNAGKRDLRFTTFENAGHGIWVKTADYNGFIDWMFEQKRADK